MNKKEVNKIVTVGLATSIVLNPISNAMGVVNASSSNNTTVKSTNTNLNKEIYLSDIGHDNSLSSPGWGGILNNTSPSGGNIKLIVDGEPTEFEKGIGAHATSTVVFNVSNYNSEYTRFVSYIGVDSRQSGSGNGVNFTISTSENGVDWEVVKDLGTVLPNQESRYVDIKLNGANYIKLYADDNGADGNDHAVYGGAKLVKDDYTLSTTAIPNLHPVSYYDNTIEQETIENNLKNNSMTILRRVFVNRVGYESIQRISNKGDIYVKGINRLLNDEATLSYFITNGPVTKNASYQRSVMAFCELYDAFETELADTSNNNFNLRLAISISLAYAKKEMVTFWEKSIVPNSPVKRYEAFQDLVTSGTMDKNGDIDDYTKWSTQDFIDLPIPMLKWVVDTRLNDDEIKWLSEFVLKEKETGKRNYADAYNYIEYKDGYNYTRDYLYDDVNRDRFTKKYNLDGYFDENYRYGTKNVPRLWMIFEEGSVCGGLAQTYSAITEVLGRPSSPSGQPGHAASVTWGWNRENNRYEWMLQNDISGWVETGNQFDDRMLGWGANWNSWYNASYTVLATDAIYQKDVYMKATMLNFLAECYSDNSKKKEIYEQALEAQSINYDSIIGLINCYKNESSTTVNEYFELSKSIIKTFTYYPQVMMDLLEKIDSKITDANLSAQLDLLKHEALTKASNATKDETSSVPATKQLANHYLGKKTGELASFSFDGENANKIVLDERYKDSQIRVKYSLDGGNEFKSSEQQIIELSENELKSITAENDIIIGLVGTDTTYRIDITEGDTLTTNIVYGNDNENTLIGKLDNLEFSLDGGVNWCDYVIEKDTDTTKNSSFNTDSKGRIKFEGDKDVLVRYKANGRKLRSNELKYTFTKNSDDKTRKYVEIENITLEDCSSPNSNNHLGEHLLDGTPNTGYHTPFNQTTADKFFIAKFDKVRFIKSIEYQSIGHNGKMKDGKILTSLDGTNWTEAGTFNLENNHSLKTINLNEPTACRYVKIVADNTYGNSPGEANMYLSGNMLNFYEDATKVYTSEPTIEYSTKSITNKDVTAKIVVPEGCTLIGSDSYTFSTNGTHTFRYIDIYGDEKTVEAKVEWIDKEAPTATINYNTTEPTNSQVVATLENISSDATIINNNGSKTYTFNENGSFEFILEDKAGNRSSIFATVNWIHKTGPVVDVHYSEKTITNKDVTVTLLGLKDGDYVDNNGGLSSYTFKENGTFEFIVKDKVGNTTKVPVTVTWIDKVVPTAKVIYDINDWTNKDVTAKLDSPSEKITILKDGLNSHVFKDNGSYTFEFQDEAGNIGTATAKVSWIDKTKPLSVINFKDNTTNSNTSSVVAKLNIDLNKVQVLNNGGSPEYTFNKNGTFVFKLRLKETGYEFEVPVKVDWIKTNTSTGSGSNNGNNSSSGNSNNNTGNNSSSGSNNNTNNNSSTENNNSNNSNNSGTDNTNNNSNTNTDKETESSNSSNSTNNSNKDEINELLGDTSNNNIQTNDSDREDNETDKSEELSSELKEDKNNAGLIEGLGLLSLISLGGLGILKKKKSKK